MENPRKTKERAKKIGKLSLSIINKIQGEDGKNDIWELAVEINGEAKKIYEKAPTVWSMEDSRWDEYLDWCRKNENSAHE